MHQALNPPSSPLSLPFGNINDQNDNNNHAFFDVDKTDRNDNESNKYYNDNEKRKKIMFQVVLFCSMVILGLNLLNNQDSIYRKNEDFDNKNKSFQDEMPILTASTSNPITEPKTQPNSSSVSYSVDSMGWTHTIENNTNRDILKKSLLRESLLKERIERLEKEIQRISSIEIIERFGEGPYRVEFDITILRIDGDMKKKFHGTFVVEMAPLVEMPHSVYTFLHMVDNKLWDNTSFVHQSEHIILAQPVSPKGSKHEQFENTEGTSLLFQEYSENFPHIKYTLGFAGRPGSYFYISTENNTEHHGPGGQDNHVLSEEADPCFAKIVSGFDVVNKMHCGDAFGRDGAVVSLINRVHILN